MLRQLAILFIFALFAVGSPAQETTKEQGNAPAEAVSRKNPIKPTASSIAAGKKVFTIDCEMCHGEQGDGKGEVAVSMKLAPPDFRDETAMKKFTDGDLFDVISNGKGGMPAEGKRASENQIWDLVNYVRSFAKKTPPPAEK
jgi:mono/diheme cytochrome c family protein